jgi:hypothetical protein
MSDWSVVAHYGAWPEFLRFRTQKQPGRLLPGRLALVNAELVSVLEIDHVDQVLTILIASQVLP